MSLFGIIPMREIKDLAFKCENYIIKHLEDQNQKKSQNIS